MGSLSATKPTPVRAEKTNGKQPNRQLADRMSGGTQGQING